MDFLSKQHHEDFSWICHVNEPLAKASKTMLVDVLFVYSRYGQILVVGRVHGRIRAEGRHEDKQPPKPLLTSTALSIFLRGFLYSLFKLTRRAACKTKPTNQTLHCMYVQCVSYFLHYHTQCPLFVRKP